MTTTTIPTGTARKRPIPKRPVPPPKTLLAKTLKYLSLIGASIVVIGPLLVVFFASLKSKDELYDSGPLDVPGNWLNLDNYETAFFDGRMGAGLVNTALILLISVTGTIIIGTMAAYAVSRFAFALRKPVLLLFLLAALVPGVTTQVATFQVVNSLGLFNTRTAAIALFMGTDIVSIYIFLQFMKHIPMSLDEAALIDGASHFRIYRSVIMPLLRPAIATVVIIKGVVIYNEFYIPFLYMPARELGMVSTSLFRFQGPTGTRWEIISAGVMITVIPTLVVFLLLQRHIYSGFTRGAVK
jgi:multiple sugar transport system permease protein